MNLLATLVEGQFESAWLALPKSACRESQVGEAPTWNGDGLTAEEASQYVDAVAQMLRDSQVVSELPLPRAFDFRAAMSRGISSVLEGEADPAAVLTTVQREFNEIADDLGRDTLRAAYRRGLGLATSSKLTPVTSQ